VVAKQWAQLSAPDLSSFMLQNFKSSGRSVFKKKRAAAFTIAEVCVAVAFLAVTILSVYGGISWSFLNVKLARENLRATQIALEKMETIRMYSWDQINSNGFVLESFTAPLFPGTDDSTNSHGLTYHGTTVLTNANMPIAYSNDMRRVIVTITWTNNNVARKRTMETFISQYGMQRYIY
jgi:Tfp pilus assembly protein PilV